MQEAVIQRHRVWRQRHYQPVPSYRRREEEGNLSLNVSYQRECHLG
ncbi:hypothetical protein XNW1_4900005 [Xenorhabdus nematophila str. Websteri]|nr:hypothetical protein XNA1_1720006 [Xenorhabdus nematophila str. Anatoliense]CEE94945.1 hypothetical protein XNA1_4860007 [Xenorhabdus nematophila str. Anatoliense]CEF28969.1 hypothetical protein XNW1_1470005 [Xenorhabdus nematophila str. Websteri]CEF33705.1 hypothetical protein XNW1_4900005 [Xenorhabdus nematophila str. Websteri]